MLNYDLDKVKEVNVNFVRQYIQFHNYMAVRKDGEHYKLLAYLSTLLDNETIYDIGSYKGFSAIALSMNPTNQVISYDIGYFLEVARQPENVEWRIGNFYKNKDLLKSPLIMFDIEPHAGKLEKQFYDYLVDNKYKGTVVFDDINLNDGMKEFWNSVTIEKVDVTKYGHWSGTGLVIFK
jgi:hypothetical protein